MNKLTTLVYNLVLGDDLSLEIYLVAAYNSLICAWIVLWDKFEHLFFGIKIFCAETDGYKKVQI